MPRDIFQHKKWYALHLLEAIDCSNARMIKKGEHTRFTLESGQSLRIARESLGENLDRHLAAQSAIPTAVDFTHPTDAKLVEDLVGTEFDAGRKGHTPDSAKFI